MLDKLAKDLFTHVEHSLGELGINKEEKAEKVRAVIEAQLAKLNMVPRQEFDAQCAVLARTRARVEQLEQQLAELEAKLKQE